ncbi:uncharacterized protein B0H18DRAFT_358315 [Fomitopsis serialis]|uniref:uncharacterized protein n=1 Tax=Fomitopsis serialis TaxID=139415 RepID=UPI00200772D1|nr:uncharacterized protein B0H18DRAFT_358315 [Neoantrodia serialis]KAH9911485.1 hypothetical protein B0H18DRAFT_358315 [Neoantrodia serialis]
MGCSLCTWRVSAAVLSSVVEGAEKFLPKDPVWKHNQDSPIVNQDDRTVLNSATELIQHLNSESMFPLDRPLVILCFDESHMLTKTQARDDDWTRFSELRRSLHMICTLPIFTLFLSTMGKVEQFAPFPQQERSGRIVGRELEVFPPIVLTPFDVFAEHVSGPECTLQRVASTQYMAHLGRPLFGALYDTGRREEIVHVAEAKLLNSQTSPEHLTQNQLLACMGVRIPLVFKASVPDDLEKERLLVADHMRLLLYASTGFARVLTTCSSEPLLAEASYMALVSRRWSGGEAVALSTKRMPMPLAPISVLAYHLANSQLSLGERGETVAAVLLLDARDRATTFPLAANEPLPGTSDAVGHCHQDLRYDGALKRRIVTVSQFLKALLAKPCNDVLPTECDKPGNADVPLGAAFKECYIYFNHFVKTTSVDMVNQRRLRAAMTRGAAYICADSQAGIDIIIPVLSGTVLARAKVSALTVRVKNNTQFAAEVQNHLFEGMDPYVCGVFDDDVADPPPVLRMVFALASPESSVTVPSQRPPPTGNTGVGRYTAYDIWCAGARGSTFAVIREDEEDAVGRLLETLRAPDDVGRLYKPGALRDAVRAMQPLATDCNDYQRIAYTT